MKKHSGMRPHDVVVLLKIASKGPEQWYMKDLAYELGISSSEISESINRSVIAGLISSDKKKLNKLSLMDFLRFGLKYVYPQKPGPISRGIATAHSAPPLKFGINSNDNYVWSYAKGNLQGQTIEPLHPKVPEASLKDNKFYEMISLVDAIRVGKAREYKMAVELLRIRLEHA